MLFDSLTIMLLFYLLNFLQGYIDVIICVHLLNFLRKVCRFRFSKTQYNPVDKSLQVNTQFKI